MSKKYSQMSKRTTQNTIRIIITISYVNPLMHGTFSDKWKVFWEIVKLNIWIFSSSGIHKKVTNFQVYKPFELFSKRQKTRTKRLGSLLQTKRIICDLLFWKKCYPVYFFFFISLSLFEISIETDWSTHASFNYYWHNIRDMQYAFSVLVKG